MEWRCRQTCFPTELKRTKELHTSAGSPYFVFKSEPVCNDANFYLWNKTNKMPKILLNFHLIFRSKIQMSDSRKLIPYGEKLRHDRS